MMRRFGRCLAVAMGVLPGVFVDGLSVRAGDRTRSNVLFIAIDDLNDWTGVLAGHPQAKTPNLDRLARQSVLFTNAHTAAPACNPSRAALMTGIPPYRSGVYHNAQPWRPAMPDALTLPQWFRRHGYWAAGSGKIYHGAFPDPASWDTYVPSQQRNQFPNPRPPRRNLNGLKRGHFDWGPIPDIDDLEMGDAKTADWICEQLGREHDRPFFLACGFFRPHLPWYVPESYFEQFPREQVRLPEVRDDDLEDIPAAGIRMARPQGDHAAVVAAKQWHAAVQGYLASIAFVDRQLGRVLDALEKSPHADSTIVILWTDHGWHLGEKQHWRKFTLWEEATRVPLMIRVPPGVSDALPEGSRNGQRCSRPVSLMDIYPTLVDLCGLPEKQGLVGQSLRPLLADPKARWERPAITTYGRGNHAVRSQDWRYIRYADGSEELYDHRRDPQEWTNLAGDARYAAIKAELARWLPQENAPDAPGRKAKGRGRRGKKAKKSGRRGSAASPSPDKRR